MKRRRGPRRSIDDGQLVSERDDFQVQRGARLDEKSERVEQRHDDGRHDCRLPENASNLNRRNMYEVSVATGALRRSVTSSVDAEKRLTGTTPDRRMTTPQYRRRRVVQGSCVEGRTCSGGGALSRKASRHCDEVLASASRNSSAGNSAKKK